MRFFSVKPVEARRVGASLVAAFHKAEPPLVWNIDLERNHSFTLGLQNKNDEWTLGLASSDGEFKAVAHFDERKDAEEAFAIVEAVLAKGRPFVFDRIIKPLSILALIALVLALVFGAMVGVNVLKMLPKKQAVETSTPIAPAAQTAPQIKNGVPVPADDVLTPPP